MFVSGFFSAFRATAATGYFFNSSFKMSSILWMHDPKPPPALV